MFRRISVLLFLFVAHLSLFGVLYAQEPRLALPDSMMRYSVVTVEKGDTLYDIDLPQVWVSKKKYKSRQLTPAERQELWRLIRDVKRALPYAKMIAATLIETYEYMETLPDDKSRQLHLKRMEKELKAQYMPEMKKLTLRQGKLVIKLIDRQCAQSSYQLLKAFLGGWKAGWWNLFANLYGASLKTRYNPEKNAEDALTERIVLLVEEKRI